MKRKSPITALAATVLCVAACEDDAIDRPVDESERIATVIVEEIYRFESLEQLALEADLIVEGEVVDMIAGDVVGPEELRTQLAVVTIQVDRVHQGVVPSDGVLTTEVPYWLQLEDGTWVRMFRSDHAEDYTVGERGVYAFRTTEDGGLQLVNSQARILVDDDQVVVPSLETALSRRLQGMSATALRRQIDSAVAAALAGAALPATPRLELDPAR